MRQSSSAEELAHPVGKDRPIEELLTRSIEMRNRLSTSATTIIASLNPSGYSDESAAAMTSSAAV